MQREPSQEPSLLWANRESGATRLKQHGERERVSAMFAEIYNLRRRKASPAPDSLPVLKPVLFLFLQFPWTAYRSIVGVWDSI